VSKVIELPERSVEDLPPSGALPLVVGAALLAMVAAALAGFARAHNSGQRDVTYTHAINVAED